MKIGLQEIDFEMAGALLARADDNQQTEFFQAFVKECLSWGTSLQVQSQLSYVNLNLTDKEKETLSMLSFKDES